MTPSAPVGPHRVSVVICAYTEDRWGDIVAAVASVRAQSLPACETLLVVDHNPALLARLGTLYADRPDVRVLANDGPRGLSSGRNTGIAASTGEIIAFLDDDAVAERDWLLHFARAYADPRVLAVGGRTEPAWDTRVRPDWFPEEFDWVVGCMYLGHPRGQVSVRNVLGGNASFRRTAFEAAGGFATGIGRDGARLPLGCEETELCIRLRRAAPGAVLLIDDRAVIHHRVPAARARVRYLSTRSYAEGVSKAQVSRLIGARDGLSSERAYTSRVLPLGILRGLRDAALGRPGGLGRAGAIVLGACAAATGYAVGRLSAGPPLPPGTTPEPAPAPARAPVPVPGHRRGEGPAHASVQRRTGTLHRTPGPGPAPVPVLMYHALTDNPARATAALSVAPGAFAEQMELLENHGFTPLTTAELGEAWRGGGNLPRRPVLITFDDGYEGVHTHALPALTAHGFRASLFVSSGWLRGEHDTGGALDTMLTWDQVRELAGAGLEIGGHSHTHPQLDQLADARLAHEIAHCRDLIAAEAGTRPVSFAYPYGYSSRRVRQAVRDGGFGQSLAVNNTLARRSQSPYALTRLTVRRSTDLAEFACLVEGRALGRTFARDHVLGKGYAVVRHTRRAARSLTVPNSGGSGSGSTSTSTSSAGNGTSSTSSTGDTSRAGGAVRAVHAAAQRTASHTGPEDRGTRD